MLYFGCPIWLSQDPSPVAIKLTIHPTPYLFKKVLEPAENLLYVHFTFILDRTFKQKKEM
jgi:hypothetical protein